MTFEMSLGRYREAVDRRIEEWTADNAADRLWAADHTLWTSRHEAEIEDRLGWLDLPETMREAVPDLVGFADEIREAGFTDVVLLGMGGSSLAPDVFRRTFGHRPGFPALTVLDSTHPAAVEAVSAGLDLPTTLFIVASKSGTTIEPLSFFEFFWDRASGVIDNPGRNFVAITDPGSHLQQQAAERGFRRVFLAKADVGGRYSALTHFGLVPAALIGADVETMLRLAGEIASSARSGRDGFALGAALGELGRSGRDKATFFTSPTLAAYPQWAEQLIAESTGKDGKGILPVADEVPGTPGAYQADRVFVSLTLASDEHESLDAAVDALEKAGHPVIRITIDEPEALAAEMYRAEVAVAMAGSVLGIHPFNQPDVQAAKLLARQAMAGELEAGHIEEIPADDERLAEALTGFLGRARPGDYLAIQAFISPTLRATGQLQAIRHLAGGRLSMATTLGFGPRFLHSTGQLHKGGPGTGLFVQIVDHATPTVDVPGRDFTFGTLIEGQADGDYRALAEAGRRVIRVCLGDDVDGGLTAIGAALEA